MRRDVHKVMSERPKSGRTWESKTPRKRDVVLDVGGDQVNENSDHVKQARQKGRRTRFNVLERFLVSRVGRPWDKVYAETCKVADSRKFPRLGGSRLLEDTCRNRVLDGRANSHEP